MGSYYTLTNEPETPVELADAKDFLRVDFSKDDGVIQDMITTAINWGENYTGRDFSNKEWTGFFTGLCTNYSEPRAFLELQRSPVTNVTEVAASSSGNYAAYTEFFRKQRSGYDRLLFTGVPSVDDSVPYTFRVTFTSGFTSFPIGLKEAVLEMVAFLYENRGDAPSNAPDQIKMMFAPYKLIQGYV